MHYKKRTYTKKNIKKLYIPRTPISENYQSKYYALESHTISDKTRLRRQNIIQRRINKINRNIYSSLNYNFANMAYFSMPNIHKRFVNEKENENSNKSYLSAPLSEPIKQKEIFDSSIFRVRTLHNFFMKININLESFNDIKNLPPSALKEMLNYHPTSYPCDFRFEKKTLGSIALATFLIKMFEVESFDKDNEALFHQAIKLFYSLAYNVYCPPSKSSNGQIDDTLLDNMLFNIDHFSSIKKNYGQDCSQENKKNYIGKCVGYYQTFLTNVLYNHQNNIEKYFKIFVNKLSDKKILYDEFTNDLDKMFTHSEKVEYNR